MKPLACAIMALLATMAMIIQADSSFNEPVELGKAFAFSDLMYTFKSTEERDQYLSQGINQMITLAGLKIDAGGQMYVSTPRWGSRNIPASLSKVVFDANQKPVFDPYPSWAWNNVSDTKTGLQNVLGFEIDSKQRMWILDQGKVTGQPAEENSLKLVVWDMERSEVIFIHYFTPEEVSPYASFLNDIVVDSERGIAYISDSGDVVPSMPSVRPQSGLLVVDINTGSVKRWFNKRPEVSAEDDLWVVINSKKCSWGNTGGPLKIGINGIALSCDGKRLYWTALTSRTLYGIPTDELLNNDPSDESVAEKIVNFGNKISASDGLGMSSEGKLYMTAIERNTIYEVDESLLAHVMYGMPQHHKEEFTLSEHMRDIVTNISMSYENELVWPDTIAIGNGHIYFTTDNVCEFSHGALSKDAPNFFIHRKKLDALSYTSGVCTSMGNMHGISPSAIAIIVLSVLLFLSCGICTIVVVIFIGKARKMNALQKPSAEAGLYQQYRDQPLMANNNNIQ